ncbi:MAG: hypothetical protein M1533_02080 [Candidatus Thermoplasmatota archaeon]|nr:hypothetical protein [Candidatus Thermoplasmatota archaeon]MCL5794344.1 hypothetical protein [Candidatus Thermoplasmatota archaeon]
MVSEGNSNSKWKEILLSPKDNIVAVLTFISILLVIGPFIPGVSWFSLGDFSLDMVNFYHTIMIPFVFLLILYASELLGLGAQERKAVNLSTYPVLFLTVLGTVFFYPASTQTADYVLQALRDVWMLVLALMFLVYLLGLPLRDRQRFKNIWGAYTLIVITTISAGIAAVMGMIYEYGNLFGYASLPAFNNDVTAWGGLQTFLGNLITSHSHQMLPAVMGGIIGLATVSFGYEKLSSVKRNFVNAGLVIAVIGTISMSYLYFISSFGTYVIPAIFTSGTGGMNGLALDDSQTGIVGIGALVTIIGLYYLLSGNRADRLVQISEMLTWIATMAVMIGVGYAMEFNETYYGFGSPGVPPNGGPGYQYDMAFTDGHLLFAFFLMPLVAGILLLIMHYIKEFNTEKRMITYFIIAGTIIGGFGVLEYVLTLSWIVEAIGLALLIIAIIITTYTFGKSATEKYWVKGKQHTN